MSDPMPPEVRDWMKRTDAEPPDAQRSARQVMTRLPEVRQRSRWWPFPVRYRTPKAPTTNTTTNATTEYQPGPIPATNGHTPTVIGRTQSMFSPVKAITAGAIVATLGGVMLISQPFEQQGMRSGGRDRSHRPDVGHRQHAARGRQLLRDRLLERWRLQSPQLRVHVRMDLQRPAPDRRCVGALDRGYLPDGRRPHLGRHGCFLPAKRGRRLGVLDRLPREGLHPERRGLDRNQHLHVRRERWLRRPLGRPRHRAG